MRAALCPRCGMRVQITTQIIRAVHAPCQGQAVQMEIGNIFPYPKASNAHIPQPYNYVKTH